MTFRQESDPQKLREFLDLVEELDFLVNQDIVHILVSQELLEEVVIQDIAEFQEEVVIQE